MKKRLLPLFVFTLLSNTQRVLSQCDDRLGFETIAANKVKAGFPVNGDIFIDPERQASYIVPYTPGLEEVHTFYAGALWLGAYDSLGNLKTAAQFRNSVSDKVDYWPGPIDDVSGSALQDGCNNFNRVWKINRGEILMLLEDYEDNGQIDHPVALSLLSWPARGNPHFEDTMGFLLPDQNLAPFFDRNSNGVYEPQYGEYPVIDSDSPQVIPDELLWCVFNDLKDEHPGSGGSPLGVEVHLLGYAFNCEENEVLNHSVFTRHKIFNKSGQVLENFRVGLWLNGDIGCQWDDFIGCDTTLNTIYFYNSDNEDGNSIECNAETAAYGESPPVQAVTFLNQDLEKFAYFLTTAIGSPPPLPDMFIPKNASDFYNYLSGKWRSGIPYTYGEDGYDPSSTDIVNYVFFDNPNNSGWTMYSPEVSWEEKTAVASKGTMHFQNDTSVTLDVAFSFYRAQGVDHLGNVNEALENIPAIQTFYDGGFSSGCTQFQFCESNCVWPGDANADGIAKEDDLLYLCLGIANGSNGPKRTPTSNLWAPQESEDWGINFFDGKEIKHADCNGDGRLDSLDEFVLAVNFYKELPDYIRSQVEAPEEKGALYVNIYRNAISTQDSPLKRYIRAGVMLATEALPFQSLSGISFVVEFDTSLFREPIVNLPIYDLPAKNFLGSGSEIITLAQAFPKRGQIAFATARKDGLVAGPAFGHLLDVAMEMRSDAVISSPDSFEFVKLKVFDAYGVTAAGEIITIGVEYDSILVTNMGTIPTPVHDSFYEKFQVEIWPNPNTGNFNLKVSEHDQSLELVIRDLFGKKVWRGRMPSGQTLQTLSAADYLQSGIYFLEILQHDGHFTTQRLIIK